MKRALLAGLVIATLAAVQPASAETATYGPGGTGVGTATPTYETPIVVIDTMASTLSPNHRRTWRLARDQALEAWGLPFEVRRLQESALAYPWTLENVNGGLAITDIVPGAILIVRDRSMVGQSTGGWLDEQQGGIVALGPWSAWWAEGGIQQIASTLAHETGHALGFGHGGTGVMNGALKVNDEERALAGAYFG